MKKRRERQRAESAASGFKFATTAIVASFLLWSPGIRAADLNTEMQKLFNDIGSMGTASGPSAYRGQSMNLYTGGELHMRTPIRTYQLFAATLPSIKGSCGGIDAYMGSFSYINGNQWKGLIKNLGGPIVGLLIQSALKSINPLIASTIEDLQKVIQWANQANVNSCEAAKQIVAGLSNMTGVDTYSSCMEIAEYYGWDQAEARDRCRTEAPARNETARVSGDPNYNKTPPRNINLLWHALSGTTFTRDEKETFINIAGTFVVRGIVEGGSAAAPAPKRYEAMLDSNFDLLFGTDAPTSTDTVRIQWWQCEDTNCLTMTQSTRNVTSYHKRVTDLLLSIRNKMRAANSSDPLSAAEISFVNNTTIPVWKMLNVGYMDSTEATNDLVLNKYSAVIALDYAHTFFTRALKEASFYLDQADWRGSAEESFVKDIRETIRSRKARFEREREAVNKREGSLQEIIAHMQQVERALYAGMAVNLRANVDWSSAMKTQFRF